MPTFTDPQFRELDAVNRRAQEQLDKSDWAGALKTFQEVAELARKLGIDTSWASWGLAICNDNLGDLTMAFDNMRESLRTDPLNLGKQASYDQIVQHIRAALASTDRADDDPTTPMLYEQLARAGEADVGAHLAMARHLAAAGEHAAALELLDAVTRLHPGHRQAWERKASVARALGDAALAGRCDVEAAGCAGAGDPFGVRQARASA
ncbi:MAG: tetratricopeptide repeat protein [Anaeromyxobacteraceae bacterium]|nr:tetratricopeptide repeat protein [Anaeromyxobacteraceae bacterium]